MWYTNDSSVGNWVSEIYEPQMEGILSKTEVSQIFHGVQGTSLVVQWLRIRLPAQGTHWIPGQGTKIPHAIGQLSQREAFELQLRLDKAKKNFFPSDTLCYKQKLFKIKMSALCTCSTLQKMLKLFFRFRSVFLTSVLSVAGGFQKNPALDSTQ